MPYGMRWGPLASVIERVRTGSVLAPLLALNLICGFAAFGVTIWLGDTTLARLLWVLLDFASRRRSSFTSYSRSRTPKSFKQKTIDLPAIG